MDMVCGISVFGKSCLCFYSTDKFKNKGIRWGDTRMENKLRVKDSRDKDYKQRGSQELKTKGIF